MSVDEARAAEARVATIGLRSDGRWPVAVALLAGFTLGLAAGGGAWPLVFIGGPLVYLALRLHGEFERKLAALTALASQVEERR